MILLRTPVCTSRFSPSAAAGSPAARMGYFYPTLVHTRTINYLPAVPPRGAKHPPLTLSLSSLGCTTKDLGASRGAPQLSVCGCTLGALSQLEWTNPGTILKKWCTRTEKWCTRKNDALEGCTLEGAVGTQVAHQRMQAMIQGTHPRGCT